MGVSGSTLSGRPLRMQARRVDASDTLTTQGTLKDVFGEYKIVNEKFTKKKGWHCKHQYAREGGTDGYHYLHLDGRYYSQNPDGSVESINPILKEAFYTPPKGDRRVDCSDEVDWEGLNEIPDLCIVRASITHKLVGEFIEKMKSQEESTIRNDDTKKRKICANMLRGKENANMDTEDEAEEVECETEEVSDDEEETPKKQRKTGNEDHMPKDIVPQKNSTTPEEQTLMGYTPMMEDQLIDEHTRLGEENTPEEQTARAMTPISNFASENESIDEPMDLGETEGTSSQKRKANVMDDPEEGTTRIPPARRSMNRRRESKLTDAQRLEQKRASSSRRRASTKAKKP